MAFAPTILHVSLNIRLRVYDIHRRGMRFNGPFTDRVGGFTLVWLCVFKMTNSIRVCIIKPRGQDDFLQQVSWILSLTVRSSWSASPLTTAFVVLLAAATASALPAPNRMAYVSSDVEHSAFDYEVIRFARLLVEHDLHAVSDALGLVIFEP
ncbi:hypothetical protein BV25DRAFT_1176535 [Artomyces pyxidatus]|uniref:Uncharacterized protein n=1 Tax=Artomyces pyxidatus TaxID=48021 RepID=A0ACB8SR13_9AGAM|nr:hypothetical protein BV25DRAFT_1176535 [Artomyces pyxidatus]